MNIDWPTNTGELNRRVKIKEWADLPSELNTGLNQTFTGAIERWAKRDPVRGVAYWQGKQIGEEVTDIWYFRYADGTLPEQLGGEKVIEHNGRRFRILRAMDPGNGKTFSMVWTKDLGAI